MIPGTKFVLTYNFNKFTAFILHYQLKLLQAATESNLKYLENLFFKTTVDVTVSSYLNISQKTFQNAQYLLLLSFVIYIGILTHFKLKKSKSCRHLKNIFYSISFRFYVSLTFFIIAIVCSHTVVTTSALQKKLFKLV